MRRSSASGDSAVTPSKNCPVSIFQRRTYSRRIGALASSESSSTPIGSRWRPRRNSPPRAARRFRTHSVSPRGATRYRVPPISTGFTGVRICPDFRPRTTRMRDPRTLRPRLVTNATRGLKRCLVSQSGFWYRTIVASAGGDRCYLLDHLIRPLQERRRDREAEGLGGLEVDHELARADRHVWPAHR